MQAMKNVKSNNLSCDRSYERARAKRFLVMAILMIVFYSDFIKAQSLSPSVLSAGGKYISAGGYTLSGTLGEPMHTTFQNGNIMVTQGQQQPYILLRLLHLKAFLEGFYSGGGQMQAVLYNNFPLSYSSTSCDSIHIELRESVSPYAPVASANAILQTNGSAEVQFPAAYINAAYYIVLRHRNSIETWSKTPVSFTGTAVYFDFTAP